MALEHELSLLPGQRRDSLAERAANKIRLTARARLVRAYRTTFLDAEGHLTRAGEDVIADLAKFAGFGTYAPQATAEQLQFREGQRSILLRMFARMDPKALRKLGSQMREQDDE